MAVLLMSPDKDSPAVPEPLPLSSQVANADKPLSDSQWVRICRVDVRGGQVLVWHVMSLVRCDGQPRDAIVASSWLQRLPARGPFNTRIVRYL